MSENQKYQDTIEQECLDFVKNDMNEKDGIGLTDEQYIEIREWINEAKPNSSNNKFPDFVLNEGFIEHFAVTSSQEDKKGAKQRRKSRILHNKSKSSFLKELNNSKTDGVVFNYSYSQKFEVHSHFNIMKSIKKNWEKHIESYDKNISTSKKRIFLIEYIDVNLETATSNGNQPIEVFDTYRISVDKQILDWIYIYKDKIDYLIFINRQLKSIEIIRIDNIPEIKEKIPNVWYKPNVGMEVHKFEGVKTKKKGLW